ncbi:MAG: hypothetical protein BWZ10_02581 [candidate division BRC1 bacterium ADurb.BinA364]|nr:MAG: hypothetical protein BWZ10_02581 [candidate division BRC1 bacterium ADurb.BinA364]
MSEWIELFNGKDLSGWEDFKNPHLWSVESGMIVAACEKGKMSNLSTREQFGDFELHLEYNADAQVNSGVFVRVSDLKDEVHTGLEIQILDTAGKEPPFDKHDSGALYDMAEPKVNAVKPAGEWNALDIRCQGATIEVKLNGLVTVSENLDEYKTAGLNPDGTKNKFKYAWATMPRKGHIGLQTHPSMDKTGGPKIRFKNIRVRAL